MSLYYRQFQARQKAIEEQYAGLVYKAIRGQYQSFLNAANREGYAYARANIDSIVRMDGIARVLKRLYRTCAYVEGKYQYSSLMKKPFRVKRLGPGAGFSVGFDDIAQTVDDYFRIYMLNKSAIPITETSKKYIRDHLIAESDRGVPYDEAVTNFRELAIVGTATQSSNSRIRAQMIIQTEITGAMSFGGLIGAYMTGIDLDKEWITSDDEKVRGASSPARFPHTMLDRQVTTLFGSFNNGEPIKMPGDKGASIANIAKCRCAMFYKQKDRPKPRDTGRQLSMFLTEFFTGFLQGALLAELIEDGE